MRCCGRQGREDIPIRICKEALPAEGWTSGPVSPGAPRFHQDRPLEYERKGAAYRRALYPTGGIRGGGDGIRVYYKKVWPRDARADRRAVYRGEVCRKTVATLRKEHLPDPS